MMALNARAGWRRAMMPLHLIASSEPGQAAEGRDAENFVEERPEEEVREKESVYPEGRRQEASSKEDGPPEDRSAQETQRQQEEPRSCCRRLPRKRS